MMTIESSFFPFPSEVAMIPAGYLASIWEMQFSIALFFGILWALLGASINYYLGMRLWGPIIHTLIQKYGKYIFLTDKHYTQAETYFQKHGAITTLLGRFIPAIRQLISIPAGVFKMNFAKFLFYTWLGAGIWNLILMLIGYIAGENSGLIQQYSKESIIALAIFIAITTTLYILIQRRWNK